MKFGLTDEQYKILETILIKPLQSRQAELFVFGSRARGNHHPYSDIDIMYKENPESSISDSFVGQIKENLENSNLPIKVDLVSDKDLAKSYRDSVEKDLKKI